MQDSNQTKTSFTLTLDTLIKGNALVLPNAHCTFSYHGDAEKKIGQAQLSSINGSMLAITLYPEGLTEKLSFFSDIQPTAYTIKGVSVVINKVLLQLIPEKNIQMAAIEFNYDGAVIQATANFVVSGVTTNQ